jgi:antitoxin VapB
MAHVEKARVFMSGRSQAVRIPAEYRFTSKEVYIRRDAQSGDVILSQAPDSWNDVYAALDKAGFPEEFLADRNQGLPQERDEL